MNLKNGRIARLIEERNTAMLHSERFARMRDSFEKFRSSVFESKP